MDRREFVDRVKDYLKLWDLPGLNERAEKIYLFYDLLAVWNKKVNLTNITSPIEFIKKHVIDSAYLLKLLPGPSEKRVSLMDIGSGAGLPGIILSILRDNIAVTGVESVSKKCLFQRTASRELSLANFKCLNLNIYSYSGDFASFSGIVSRAAFSFKDLLKLIDFLPPENLPPLYFFMSDREIQKQVELPVGISSHSFKNKRLYIDRILFYKTDYTGEKPFRMIVKFVPDAK